MRFHRLPIILCATAASLIAAVAELFAPTFWISVAISVLGWLMLAIALIDVRHFRIPDVLSWPATVVGLVTTFVINPTEMAEHFLAAFIASGGLWLLRALYQQVRGVEGLGLGDVKLAATAGAWVGIDGLSPVLLLASVGALLAVCFISVLDGKTYTATSRVPFGAFLAPAIWLIFLAQNQNGGKAALAMLGFPFSAGQ